MKKRSEVPIRGLTTVLTVNQPPVRSSGPIALLGPSMPRRSVGMTAKQNRRCSTTPRSLLASSTARTTARFRVNGNTASGPA